MLTGRMLDRRYHVRSRIAHGGMATVYLATDTRLDREVALKVMHADLARDAEFVARFIGEAKSVAQLSHQNIVAVFDQGADGEYLFLAMEYVPGRTLRSLMRERGWFTWQEALGIMDPILAGLAAAHQAGIVHRDVKPENVLITPDGRVKVVDFGLARASAAVGNTRAGQIIGSVAYIAPEQVTGAVTDARTDVYSAGVLLFEMLTGRQPYTGETPLAVAYAHVNSDVPSVGSVVGGVIPAVDQLVGAATSRDPQWRPANADVFWRAVRSLRGLSGPDESVSGAWTAPAGAGAAGTVAGAAAAGTLGYGGAGFAGGDSFDGRGGGHPYGGPGMAGPGMAGAGMAGAGTLEAAGGSSTTMFDGGGYGRGAANGAGAGYGAGYGGGEYAATGRYDASSYLGETPGGAPGEPGGREPFLQRWLFSRRLAYLAVAVVAVIGLGGGGWWLTSGRYTTVPSVDRTSVTAAEQELRQAGFQVSIGSSEIDNDVAKNDVISTSPSGRALPGATIVLTVSLGPHMISVPTVAGKSLQQAEAGAARGRADGELDDQAGRRQRDRGAELGGGHRAAGRHVVAAEPARHHRGGGRPVAAQPGRAGRQLDRAVGGRQQHPPAADHRAEQPAAGHHRVPVGRPRHPGPARIDGQRLGVGRAAGGADPRQPDRRALPAGAADADGARLQGDRPAAERVRPEGHQPSARRARPRPAARSP